MTGVERLAARIAPIVAIDNAARLGRHAAPYAAE
jgi:hypothetical protein